MRPGAKIFNYNHECPVHKGAEDEVLLPFGNGTGVTIISFTGCECCLVQNFGQKQWYPDYRSAAVRARKLALGITTPRRSKIENVEPYEVPTW